MDEEMADTQTSRLYRKMRNETSDRCYTKDIPWIIETIRKYNE